MTNRYGLPQAPLGQVSNVGGAISTDVSTGIVFSVDLDTSGTNTLQNPTNIEEGQSYTWQLRQNASTAVDVTFGDVFYFGKGFNPSITQTPSAVDIVHATAINDGSGVKLYATLEPNVKAVPSFTNTYAAMLGDIAVPTDNTSQYMTGGNVLDKDGSSSFTISVWLKIYAGYAPSLSFILTKSPGASTYAGYQITYGDGTGGNEGKLSLSFTNTWPSTYWKYNTSSATLLADGGWHHCVFVVRGTSSAPLIYVDGSLVAAPLAGGATFSASTANSADLVLGSRDDLTGGSIYYFTGNVDELSFFDDELTAGEILALYNGGVPTDLAGHDHLEAWWRMGDDASDDFTSATGQMTDQVGSLNLTPQNTTSANKVSGALTSVSGSYAKKVDAYSMAAGDVLIGVDTTGGAFTITAPNATHMTPGRLYYIKDEGSACGANPLTLAPYGSQTIDGVAAKVISNDDGALTFYGDGSNLFVVNEEEGNNLSMAQDAGRTLLDGLIHAWPGNRLPVLSNVANRYWNMHEVGATATLAAGGDSANAWRTSLDGATGFESPGLKLPHSGTKWSAFLVFEPTSATVFQVFLDYGNRNAAGEKSWNIYVWSGDSKLYVEWSEDGTTLNHSIASTNNVLAAKNRMYFYYDGANIGLTLNGTTMTPVAAGATGNFNNAVESGLRWGMSGAGGDRLTGGIETLLIWEGDSAIKSATEIADLMTAGNHITGYE